MVKTLFDRESNISIHSSNYDTPHHQVTQWSDPETVQLLLSASANTLIRSNHGDTTLRKYTCKISGFCLDYHDCDGRGMNPRPENLRMVLQSTVDLNTRNSKGETALHALMTFRLSDHMTQGRMKAATLLIEKGADVGPRNGDGITVGDLFVQNDTDPLLEREEFLAQLLTDSNT